VHTFTSKFRQSSAGPLEKLLVDHSFSSKLYQMDPNENPGLCDETVDIFGEFMKMVEETLYLSEIETECSICLNSLQRPHVIDPCGHMFCQACLIRLSQAQGRNCPNCRGAINSTNLKIELHLALQNHHPNAYQNRHIEELESGVYDIPMDWSPVEEFDTRLALVIHLDGAQITIFLPTFD
jgi:hypothetical protein